jgi:hypothetical protein
MIHNKYTAPSNIQTREPTEISDFSTLLTSVTTSGEYVIIAPLLATEIVMIPSGVEVTLSASGNGSLTRGVHTGHIIQVETTASLILHDIVIDGDYENRGTQNTLSLIKNFGVLSIEDGTYLQNNYSPEGGGLYNNNELYINGGLISDNTAAGSGGGIYNASGFIIMQGGTIQKNTAGTFGGGLCNSASFTLNGGTIYDNEAQNGGGILNGEGYVEFNMHGGLIYKNIATRSGAGIFFNDGGTAPILIDGASQIIENESTLGGGGLRLGALTAPLTIGGTTQISGNIAHTNGGGISISYSALGNLFIEPNVTFSNNEAAFKSLFDAYHDQALYNANIHTTSSSEDAPYNLLFNNSDISYVSYIATFDSAGGTAVPYQVVSSGNLLPRPADPTKCDYVFIDWYKADESLFDFDYETIIEPITLHAVWQPYEDTISPACRQSRDAILNVISGIGPLNTALQPYLEAGAQMLRLGASCAGDADERDDYIDMAVNKITRIKALEESISSKLDTSIEFLTDNFTVG